MNEWMNEWKCNDAEVVLNITQTKLAKHLTVLNYMQTPLQNSFQALVVNYFLKYM